MAKYKVPAVGSVVTLTTRYKETYYYSDQEWRDTTYENVRVMPPEPWFKPGMFKISSDDPRMPFRVVAISNVHHIVDGDEADADTTSQTVTVPGRKKGSSYDVVIQDGDPIYCPCTGFSYRRKCRHLQEALDLIRETPDGVGCEKGSPPPEGSGQSTIRRPTNMSKNFTWGQRLALIDAYSPTDGVACTALSVTIDELGAARELLSKGTISLDTSVVKGNSDIFKGVKAAATTTRVAKTDKPEKAAKKTTAKKAGVPAATASPPVRTPKKRGRKGSKIQNAFAAIPTDPTDATKFATKHSVSLAVLRQAKRFDKAGTGVVRVRKDRESGVLMVWREDEASS